MDSILNYIINLQTKGGDNVVSVAQRVDTQLQTVQRRAGSVGKALGDAFSFSNFKGSLMNIPGMSFLMNPYTLIGAGVGAIAKVGAEAEMTSVAFRTLVGDESKAAEMLKEINAFAAKTPFSNLDLTENAKMMLSFGVQTDKVTGYLRQLGDIAGGDKNKLSSLALVFGQVSSTGKLMGQDLMQFNNIGFNPLKELEQMTGKTYTELQEMMSKGQIGFDAVAAAIAHATSEGGKFYNSSENLSQTFSGRLSTLVGTVQQQMVEIYKVMQPAIMAVVDLVSAIVPPILTAIQTVVGAVIQVTQFFWKWREELGYLAAVVGVGVVALNTGRIAILAYAAVTKAVTVATKAVTVATKAWSTVQWLINAALTANPIGIVITAIAALVAAVIYCWNNFAGFRTYLITMWDTVKQFGNILKEYVTDRITELLNGLGKMGEALKALFDGDFKTAASLAGEGIKDISGVGSAQRLYDNTKNVANGIQGRYNRISATEKSKEKQQTEKTASISKPGLKGSRTATDLFTSGGAGSGKGKGTGSKKTAEALATGGTRNTSITMHIGKFFDNINVQMADKADTTELERTVLQCMNRALAIATSSDR